MGKIFILRHGPTDSYDNLNISKFKYIRADISDHIKKEMDPVDTFDMIFTSPLSRCYLTAKLLKMGREIKPDDDITRRSKKTETSEELSYRLKKFIKKLRKHTRKNEDANYLIVLNSSIYRKFIEIIASCKVKKEELHFAALSIIDIRCDNKYKLSDYNLLTY